MRKTRTENHRKAWTQVELEFVKTYYGTVPTENIAKILGRTFDAVRWVVRNQKRRLMVPYHPWTEEEKEIIRTHFAAGNGIADILPLLPGRTRGAIYLMKDKLDVHSTRQWSQQERQILSQYYPVEGMAVTDRLTGRTRTSVRQAAYAMGLKLPDSKARPVQQKWSKEELQRLETNQNLSLSELTALFPGRTSVSVRKARIRLEKRQQKHTSNSES
ncbi:hypothetical protein QEA29_004533 [Salmonella enterica]|nr:hypothetical protein [Salmonella enterica subsp. enterica serovar Inganda]EJH7538649.1 hypothetical protein [Salmonella enterica]EJW2001905.1 hypothetical protein [Salmonella enterica]EJW2035295.1 hypothetical protein [Salmonella enterica]EJW2039874.1 hypothetical protein [Salmonella enterica]